ncbi:hypothetical protein ACR5KS_04995 [Leucobacter sp. W1153]|uniref:hypothetical protein n=1 Tax=Leucobacter sp. W1153 TaxID=3439064 RepID=UPI003F3032DA
MSLIWSGAVTFGPVDVPVSPAGESGDHLAPVGGEHAENSGSSRLAFEAAFGSLGDASDFGTTGSDTVAAALQFARDLGARRLVNRASSRSTSLIRACTWRTAPGTLVA